MARSLYIKSRRQRRFSPKEAERRIYEALYVQNLSWSKAALKLGVSTRTIGKYARIIKPKYENGEYEVHQITRPNPDEGPTFPSFIPYAYLPQGAKDMLEDTPEGFERFFNRFAHQSDPRMKGDLAKLQPHSRMFVEAAYHRCEKHPRIEGFDVWHPAVMARSASCAKCKECGWKQALVLNVPAGFAKTTIFTTWLCGVWETVKDRDGQGLVISESNELAMQITEEICSILDGNEDLIRMYGLFKDRDDNVRWSPALGKLRVAGSAILRGFNVLSRGMGSQITGQRPSWVVCDDIIDPRAVRSATARAEDSFFFHNVIESRAADQRIWVVATRRHPLDLYGELVAMTDTDEPDQLIWEHINFPAVLDWETGETLWPERWPIEKLLKIRKRVTAAAFELTWQQRPLVGEHTMATWEDIHGPAWDEGNPNRGSLDRNRTLMDLKLPEEGSWVRVAACDPSPAHWAGLVVVDVNLEMAPDYQVIVRWAERWKGGIREVVEVFEEVGARFRPSYMIVEKNVFAVEYVRNNEVQQVCARHGMVLIGHETRRNRSDPELGFDSMGADFENGRIRLPWGDNQAQGISMLVINEATTYLDKTVCTTTDVLMALWFVKVALRQRRFRDPKRLTGVVTSSKWHDRLAPTSW